MEVNFPIVVIASSAFVARALDSAAMLNLSVSRKLVICYIYYGNTGLRSCCITAYYSSFFSVIVVYVLFFKISSLEEVLLCIHNFQGQPIGLCRPSKEGDFFRDLCLKLFGPYCQLPHYSWSTILSCYLSPLTL